MVLNFTSLSFSLTLIRRLDVYSEVCDFYKVFFFARSMSAYKMARVEIAADDIPFVQLGKHVLRLDLEELDDEMKERSRKELRETPEVVEESIAKLRELIAGK